MFERFTHQARDAVVRAQLEARQLGHHSIGAEHLFLGVLAAPDAPGVSALTRLGVTAERFRDQTTEVLGSARDLGPSDSDALQIIGIDLEEVRRRVEASFGPGALERPIRRRRSWLPWRRERCVEPVGHLAFTPRAKRVMEYALRQALARKDRHVGPEHILLALLPGAQHTVDDSVAVEVLRHLDVDPVAVRREVLADLEKAA